MAVQDIDLNPCILASHVINITKHGNFHIAFHIEASVIISTFGYHIGSRSRTDMTVSGRYGSLNMGDNMKFARLYNLNINIMPLCQKHTSFTQTGG